MATHPATAISASLILALAAPAQTSRATPPSKPPLARKLDDYLRRCASHGWSGAALVARHGEFLVRQGYGLADRETRRAVTSGTLFEIASSTKQFTAAAILKLEEQGKLKTSDSIDKYLPGVPTNCKDITIYQLLTHTSGMSRFGPSGHGHDLKTAVKAFLQRGPSHARDTKMEYWNGGYALLAGIVARASGQTYEDYCRKHLFEPAGLKHTGFTGDKTLGAPEATAYAGSTRLRTALGHPYRTYGYQYKGMGGVVTTVEELFAWYRALQGDKVLAKKTRTMLFKPYRGKYACGWYVLEGPHGPKITHGGDVRGFHTQYMFWPQKDIAIIITANVEGIPMWTLASNLEALVFGTPLKYPAPPMVANVAAAELDKVVGRYRVSKDSELVIQRSANGLRIGGRGAAAAQMMDIGLFTLVKRRAFGTYKKERTLAERIVREIGTGKTDLLATTMHAAIPARWPEQVRTEVWPARVKANGKLINVMAYEVQKMGSRLQVRLALTQERGITHAYLHLQQGKVMLLSFDGPDFAAELDMVPTSATEFTHFAWQGKKHPKLRIEKNAKGDVTTVWFGTKRSASVGATRQK